MSSSSNHVPQTAVPLPSSRRLFNDNDIVIIATSLQVRIRFLAKVSLASSPSLRCAREIMRSTDSHAVRRWIVSRDRFSGSLLSPRFIYSAVSSRRSLQVSSRSRISSGEITPLNFVTMTTYTCLRIAWTVQN